jgi:hypothetical protein
MLTYDSKAWIVCKCDESRIIAAEMKFMKTAGHIHLGYKENFNS